MPATLTTYNGSRNWNAMANARKLSFAQKVDMRWARVAACQETDNVNFLFDNKAISLEEFQARRAAIAARTAKRVEAAVRGEFPAPKGFDKNTMITPELWAQAAEQAQAMEAN